MYEFSIGHYLLYPLAVIGLSAVFFGLGYRVGRHLEHKRALEAAGMVGVEG